MAKDAYNEYITSQVCFVYMYVHMYVCGVWHATVGSQIEFQYTVFQDRCLVYMDISVEGEPYGRLVFEVRTSVYVFYVCFGFKWSILYIYVCMLSLYVCSFSHLYALKHVKTSKLCVQERRGQHRKTLLCVTRTPLSTELSLMDGYKEEVCVHNYYVNRGV